MSTEPGEKQLMESLRTRCQVLTGVFFAIVLISAVAALSDLSLLRFLQGISPGEPADDARAEGIDARQAVMGMLQLGLYAACAIVFLMWLHRAHKNLRAGGLDDLEFTPGWAVGGFFVPFLNFVRPFHVMKEVWAGSAFLSRPVEEASWRAISPAALVGWWWALFLTGSISGNMSGRLMMRADELGEFLVAGWAMLASDLVDIPAAIMAMILVRRITGFQERARTRLQTNEGPVSE